MFARGMATRNSLRAFLLAGVMLVSGAIAQVQASVLGTLTVNFNGVTGLSPAGRYDWTKTGASNGTVNALFPAGAGAIHTYCVDLQGAGNTTYQVLDTILGMPNGTPPGSIDAVAVKKIGYLVETFTTGVINNYVPNGGALTGLANNNERHAVFQAVIWALANTQNYVFGNSLDTAKNALIANVNANYVAFNYNEFNSANLYKILGLSSAGQDQIYIYGNPEYLQEVPVPAGVILAGMGIACMGGANILRRRKAVAAA